MSEYERNWSNLELHNLMEFWGMLHAAAVVVKLKIRGPKRGSLNNQNKGKTFPLTGFLYRAIILPSIKAQAGSYVKRDHLRYFSILRLCSSKVFAYTILPL